MKVNLSSLAEWLLARDVFVHAPRSGGTSAAAPPEHDTGQPCPRCGDGMMWHTGYKTLWCPGCATPATFAERAACAETPESRLRYERAARLETQ